MPNCEEDYHSLKHTKLGRENAYITNYPEQEDANAKDKKKVAEEDSLKVIEHINASNARSIANSRKNLSEIQYDIYLPFATGNLGILQHNFSLSSNKCPVFILNEDNFASVNYQEKNIASLRPMYKLNVVNLLSGMEHINSLWQFQSICKYRSMHCHGILPRDSTLSNRAVEWSTTKCRLKHQTTFPDRDALGLPRNDNFLICKDANKTSSRKFLSPLYKFSESFSGHNDNNSTRLFENQIKPETLVADDDASVPGISSLLLKKENSDASRYSSTHNKSNDTATKSALSIDLCRNKSDKLSSICHIFDYRDNATEMENVLLKNLSLLSNWFKECMPQHYNFAKPCLEVSDYPDEVSLYDISLCDPDLLNLWKILKRLVYHLGVAPLTDLLTRMLSLFEETTLNATEIQCIINKLISSIIPYCNDQEPILENSICNQVTSHNHSSVSTECSVEESNYEASTKSRYSFRKPISKEILRNTDDENFMSENETPAMRIGPESEQNKLAGEFPLDELQLKNGGFEFQIVPSYKNDDNEMTDGDQLVPSPQAEKLNTKHQDESTGFLWNAENDNVGMEIAHRNLAKRKQNCRPIRVGLSRRQRTEPLHPYLAIRH